MENNRSGKSVISWWQVILGVDLFLLLVTAIKRYPIAFAGKGKLSRHFDLAVEGNWAVWWSGAGLLALALLAYEICCRKDRKTGVPWLILSAVFAVLSLDEIGSLHERVMAGERGMPEVAPFGAVLVGLVGYALVALLRSRRTRMSAISIVAAFLCYGAVAVQEYFEFAVAWPDWARGIRAAAEEGSELLGTFFLFLAIVPLRRRGEGRLASMVPDPSSMRWVTRMVLAGFFLHSLASLLAPGFIDVVGRGDGNPLVWYPVAVFFLLFSATFWRGMDASVGNRGPWWGLSAFCLLCSAGFIYDPRHLVNDPGRYLPAVGSLLPEQYLPGLFLLFVAAGVLILSAAIPDLRASNRWYVPALLLIPALPVAEGSLAIRYLASGFVAFLAFDLFRSLFEKQVLEPKEETTWNPT